MNEINNLSCKECGKPVPQTKGKRTKEYCSIACRSNNWQKRKRNITGFSPVVKNKAISAPKSEKPADTPISDKEVRKLAKNASKGVNKKSAYQSATFKVEVADERTFKSKDVEGEFMGNSIPKGLKGVDLSIWKAEIKEKLSK